MHLGEESSDDVEDLGHRLTQLAGVVGVDLRRVDLSPGGERVEIGQLAAQPLDRVGRELVVPLTPSGLPAAEPRVVVGSIVTARRPRNRLEQVGTPDRALHRDALRRVHRALELRPLEGPDLESHPVLRALLPRPGVGIDEEEIADHHAYPLEAECVQHEMPPRS